MTIELTEELLKLHVRLTGDGSSPPPRGAPSPWREDFERYDELIRELAHAPDPDTERIVGRSAVDRAIACHFDPSLRHLPVELWKEEQ